MQHKITKLKIKNHTYYPREELNYIDPKDVQSSELPTGRVSIDETLTFASLANQMVSEFNTVSSKFPLEYLDAMSNLSIVSPDVSQMVDNIMQLGNTGHKILVESRTEAQTNRILEACNEFSERAFGCFGGIDGFVNSTLAQVARSGAVSVEWVPSENLSEIERAVFVPVSTIRFVYDPKTDRNMPWQKVSNLTDGKTGMVELNEYTYQYSAMMTLDNSPYAIPPILAALESIMISRDVMKNFKFIAKKMGLLGFMTFLMKEPRRAPGETDAAYQARCAAFLTSQAENIRFNYRDGLAVGFKDNFTVEHHSVMSSADGADKILQAIEQQVFSGLKSDPALHGRTYSTTETYAGVVYEKLLSMLTNYHRTIKSVLEYGFKLHLSLIGLDYDSFEIEFDQPKSLMSERDETTYGQKLQNLDVLYKQGIISQEMYAQEAGYEAPFLPEPKPDPLFGSPDNTDDTEESKDEEKKSNSKSILKFNRQLGKYSAVSRVTYVDKLTQRSVTQLEYSCVLDLESVDESFDRCLKDLMHEYYSNCSCDAHNQDYFAELASLPPGMRKLKQFVNDYFRRVYPNVKSSRIKAVKAVEQALKGIKDLSSFDSEQFAELVYKSLADNVDANLANSPLANNVRKSVSKIYSYFRLMDADPFGGDFPVKPTFELVDKRAVDFIKESDNFYFGKYVKDDRTKKQLQNWLKDDYLKNGRSLRDPGELAKFRERFGNRVGKEDYKVLRVVETSANRSKNWGNAITSEQAGGKTLKIAGPKDNVTCDWCKAMVGKDFEIKPVVSQIKDTLSRDPEDLPQLSPFLPGKYHPDALDATSSEQLLAKGIALPPYHPHCRHRMIVVAFN